MRKFRVLVFAVICVLATSLSPAQAAAIISFSFGSNMADGELAGAPGVHTDNWNLIDDSHLTLSGVQDYAGGAYSNMTATFTKGTGAASFHVGSGTNDPHLFSGWFDAFDGTPSTISVTNIPYPTYDVYFYMHADHDGPNRTGAFTVNGTTQYVRSLQTPLGDPTLGNGTGYYLSTDTTQTTAAGTTQGNYVVFHGLTGSTLAASLTAGLSGDSAPRNKASGFQIVGSPNPNIVETDRQGNAAYTVSNSDLLQTHATLTSASGIGAAEGTDGTGAVLTDGAFGTMHPVPYPDAVAIHNGAELIYTFDSGAYQKGYDISRIDTYTGWGDGGRADQQYSVSFSTILNPDFFVPLATVNYATSSSATAVSLADAIGGPLATGVARLKFSFPVTENGYVGYRELDVLGSPTVPEPSALALLGCGLGVLAVCGRRRQG
jgi:hypothetical protein